MISARLGIRLTSPPLTEAELKGSLSAVDEHAIRDAAAPYADPISTFGLELRVAYLLEISGATAPDVEKLRDPFFRLSQEPIIWSWWDALQQAPLDPEAMLSLVSLLNGTLVTYRQKEMFSVGLLGEPPLRFETPERARSWTVDISATDRIDGDPIKKALYRFARIIMAHPFTNANGRFARAALQGSLAQSGLAQTPFLALAPIFNWHAGTIRQALGRLSQTGEWTDYFEQMGSVLASALKWSKQAAKR